MQINSSNAMRGLAAAVGLLCALAIPAALAQIGEYVPPQSGDGSGFNQFNTKPSMNNSAFTALKTRCETDASCGKASGDVCAEAAAVLLGNDPPDHYREMGSVLKTKIALRLLERGVDSSDLAAARAYDIYNRVDVAGFLTGSVADSYRAAELMELMTKRNYAGATLRKVRSAVSLLSFTTPEAEQRQHCDMAKQMLSGGKLDADSKIIAGNILNTTVCTNLAAQARQP